MRKKLGILLSVALMMMTILSACGSATGSTSNGNVKILLTMYNQAKEGSFRYSLVEAAQKQATAMGATMDVVYAEDSIETQVSQIKNAAAEKYDVIICAPVSADTAVEMEANAGSIPIVFICNCPEDKRLSAGKYIYAGSDENVAGQIQAEYALSKLGSKSELNVIILKGPKGQSATTGRTKGAKRTFSSSGKQINYVFEDYANWDKGKAKQMFEMFLQTGNTADCVLCNNDTMAIGVVEACKENGISPSSLPIMGVNAASDAVEAVISGDMALTVYQSGDGQGAACVTAAVALAQGSSLANIEGVSDDEKYVWVPFEKVDSSNASSYKQ